MGVVRVTWAISTLWTEKISPQQVVGIQVIYTTQRRRFVYDTWDNGSRLDRVMVECTLSITHCLRLNLQLHTVDLVRTCRISSSALLRGNWQDFNWHDASRIPSAIAELLVFFVITYADYIDFQNSFIDTFPRQLIVDRNFHLTLTMLLPYLVKFHTDVLSTSLASRTVPWHIEHGRL